MAKSWEEIKREREEKVRSFSNPVQNNANKMINQGFLVADPKPQQRKWEDIRKERGYVEPEPEPTDYWKEQTVKTAFKNVNYGINMLPRGIVGVADATLGGLGIEPVNKLLDSYKDYYKKSDEELAMLNQGHEFAGGVAQGIGQGIPTIALALMNPAAAAGSLVPTTAKGTQLVANAASLANPTTLNAARTVAMSLKSNPALYSSMVTSVGNQYLQGVNEGASREQALKSAIIGGVPSALIEVSGGIENITNILANKTKGVAGAMLQSALEEGFEEIVQYPIENIGQKVAYDKDMPLFSMQEQAIINPKEMAFSGAVGATVGGLMGGGAVGVNTALNNRYSKIIDKEYKNTVNSLPEDSPILERVNQMRDDNVNIDDNTKIWVINSARQDGIMFESETDKLLNLEGQKETFFSNENNANKQTVEQGQKFVKAENNASKTVNPVLSTFSIQNINNAREVKQNVYEFYKNSIISDSNTSKPILNKGSGMNIEVSRATINQTFQADDKYIKNQDNEIKVAAMANMVDLVQNGEFTVIDNSDTPSSKKTYANITGTVNINGVPYEITMDIRRTDNGRKLFVHSLSTNYQQVVSKKSGVVYNGVDNRVRQQYPKVYDILDRIGKATNTKFKFVETIYDPSGQEAGFANGQYDPTTDSIEIALDTFNPFMVVAKHELTHVLEKESPKLYKEYKDYVLQAMKENGTYQAKYDDMVKLYENAGQSIDKNGIEDELVADATELFLTDEKAINELVAENKTLGQKILDVLRKLIDKIEDTLKVSGFTEGWLNTEQLREAERLWVNALNSVSETEKKSNSKTDKKQSLKDNPFNEKSYHPFKETDKWEEQFERRTKWLREKVDGIKTGKFKGSFGMYATVTPSIKDGKYQITVFDKNDTPMMDAQRNTVDEIAEFLQEDGFIFPEQITKYSLKNIENALVANHDVYRKDKSSLKMASEALYDLNRVRYSTKDNSGIVTIADGLTRDFITTGYVNFNGRKFKSFEDLAQIMQIYRDPRFETLRYVYVKEKKKIIHDEFLGDYNDSTYTIVGHEAVSSRIPGISQSIPNLPKQSEVTGAQYEKAFYGGMDKIKDRMKRLKADGYFILHNHPSGNPNPSSNDRHLTKFFANKIDGFIGHIVINSNKYATITINKYNGIETSVRDIDQQSIDYHKQPSVYNKILDYNTKDSDGTISMNKIASLAKSMQFVDDKSYLLYLDARGAITGLQMIPNGMPLSEMRSSNSKHFRNFIKNRLVDFGAHSAMLITENRRIFDFGLDLIEQKYIMDSIRVYTNSYSEIDTVHGVWRTQPSNYYEWAGIPEGDSQAKRVFSLKAPVEETKDLIAIHNITEEKLKGTLELGGFPVPSIAITKAEQGHDNFGEISVIFTKDTIDPQSDRRNRVFGSDVYSKRFPYINYKLDFEVVNRIKEKINKLTNEEYRKEFRISLDDSNITNTLQSSKANGDFVKGYIDEPLLKLAFLKEKGIAFKPVMKEKTFGKWEVPLLEKIKKHLGDEEASVLFRGLDSTMRWEPEIRSIINEFYRSKIKDDRLYEVLVYKEPMGFGTMDDLLQQVSRYTREGANKEIDYHKTIEKLNKVTPKKSYRDWLTNLSEGIIEKKGVRNDKDPFTPSGYRRSFEQLNDEYTLDTIIKLMKGDVRGEEGFMYGLGNVRAGMTKEFKSIKDIKHDKNKIVSPEEFREIKEKANQEYYKLNSWFSKYHKSMYGSSDAFDIAMFETAKKGSIVPSIFKAELKEDGYEVNDIPDFMIKQALDFLNSLKDMPTEYFEAKPQRAVGFDEVAAIVAPKRTDKELLQQLKEKNIKVIKYDEKVEGDRLEKVNYVKGVKFSLKDSQGRDLTKEQAEFYKDTVVRDGQGRLKVMYHGTTAQFNSFRSGDIGFHLGNKTQAITKVGKGANARIIEAYINLKNPLKVNFDSGNWNALSGLAVRLADVGAITKEEYQDLIKLGNSNHEGYYSKANKALRELLSNKGYDGIEYPNWYEGKGTSKSYIIFDGNQVKLIDNKTPTDSPDIRYQLRDNKSTKDVEKLQNTVTRLKEQFKLTKGVKLDEKAVRGLAKAILKDYSSKYSSAELETKLYNVYMGMVNSDMEYDEAQTIITEVARDIIENASALNDAMYKQYSDLRNTMRNTAIAIDDKYKGDFDAVGGWNDFRKKNFGRMNITNDGMSIDSLYQELSDLYPELFMKDIANPADQLLLISDVLDNLVPIYENPYNRDLNQAVEYLAFEIFDGMTSVQEAKPTFADRKKVEKQKAVESERQKSKERIKALRNKNADDVAWLKYQNKEKLTEVLNKEKAKRDEAVAKVRKQYQDSAYKTWWRNKINENDIKSHYQEMIKELRANRDEKLEQQKAKYKERVSGIYEDRKIRQAKDRIRNMTKKLSKMLRNPTQKQHIPKALDKTTAELLAMLDFTTDKQNENTQLKLRDLRAEFEKIAKVSDEDGLSAAADPYIVEALETLHGKRIADMNLQEIEVLRDIVGYFENMVRTYNKAFRNGKWVEISTLSENILNDLKTNAPINDSAYGGILYFKDMMNWGMLTPQMYFERMGNTFNSLYDDFRVALDVKINNTKIAQDYMKNLLKNVGQKELQSWSDYFWQVVDKSKNSQISEWTGRRAEIKSIKLDSGATIELTQSQLMSFYLLMKREQARGHIFGLGVKAAPIVAVNDKGIKYVKKQFEPVKITLDDATKMIAMLTKEQRRIADGIGKFMNTYSKQWVNEATLQNYGYELAKEENYFPIKVDRDFLKSDFDNTNLDPTFTSMGFLKATVKGAGNAIVLEDVFDVFTEHTDKAATYNAFIGITESTKKIVNYKTQDNSIKQAMNKKFGIQAFNYLKKFMVDLQGGIRTEGGSPVVSSLIRNSKRAVLGLNLRTIIQQPTAIVRASALIDVDYLIKGVAMKSNKAEMLEKSPIARWKSWGYFNLDTGRSMKDIILDTVPILDKQYEGMQIADDITWTKIWNAVKLEIENNEPGLKVGSAEYFEAVNYRFNEIIDKTQVVDTVMHRSDAMRQSDSSWKMLTAFMSEPTKSYNLLLNAVEKYNSNKSAENKKALTRTFSAWTATMLVNTLVISIFDMWRKKEDDEETFKDKWLDNILNDITGYIPIVRDIYSLFEGYSVKRMEYNGIERIVRAINRSKKYIEEMAEDEKHSYPLRLITKDWIESIAYVFGIGAINVSKDLQALLKNYTKWIDDEGVVNDIYEFMFKK